MLKRHIALILSVSLLVLNSLNVMAHEASPTRSMYTPGDIFHYISAEQIVAKKGATVSAELISVGASGEVTYEFYMPFDAAKMILFVDRQPVTRKITITANQYKQTKYVDAYMTNDHISLNPVIYAGDVKLTIECESAMQISKICFEKQQVPTWHYSSIVTKQDFLNYTDYEEAIQTAVIMHKESPIIKVNGASRYINYEDAKETPYTENGIVYLPIKTFAEAFSYYHEEDSLRGYAMLRSDNTEFVLKDGKLYQQINGGEFSEITNNILLKNNKTYIPVRYYVQALGETVAYSDGYIIIDYKERVNNILNPSVFSQLKSEFSQYMVKKHTGKTYYVSKSSDANDKNPGTEDAPFATLNRAGEVAKAGDKVIIGGGTYYETFKPANDGLAYAPIIFEAAEGEDVVISTLENITATPYDEDGLLVYDMGEWDLGKGKNQVFYKGNPIVQARYPNTNTSPRKTPDKLNLSPLWSTQGNIQINVNSDGSERYATSDTDLNQDYGYWEGALLIGMYYGGYSLSWFEIEDSEPGRLYLGDHNPFHFFRGGTSEKTDWAYITCTKQAIDIPGEWHWEDGKLYIYPPEGETAETLELQAKKRTVTIDLEDRKYVQVKGINTFGGGMKLINSDTCVVNGGEHKYVSHMTYQYDNAELLDKRDSGYDTVQKDIPHVRGETGISLSGENNAVINTKIQHSATSGITCMGRHNYISNNYISETGYAGYYACGIYAYVTSEETFGSAKGGHSIYNNTVEKSGRASLCMITSQHPYSHDHGYLQGIANEVAYNDFSDGMICSRDGGLVYSYGYLMGNDMLRTKFHHNLIWNIWPDRNEKSTFKLVYWDNAVQNTESYNNVAFWTDESIPSTGSEWFEQLLRPNQPNFQHTVVTDWNNYSAGYQPDGKNGLKASDYPLNKKFNSGSTLINTYEPTYVPDNKGYSAEKAVRSDGTTMSDKAVRLNKTGEYVCFENVEFGDKYNAFALIYRGSQYNSGDKVKIVVGDNINSENNVELSLTVQSANTKYNISENVYITGCVGTKNVYIQSTEYASAEIAGIVLLKVDDELIKSQDTTEGGE